VQNSNDETVFIIHSRDEDNNSRHSGRDEWKVRITDNASQQEVPFN